MTQLRLLEACVAICERHRLRYFLLGGSALGAVRHAGFIPWDDDIDIGLPRDDYVKFLAIAQSELQPGTFLQTPATEPLHPVMFAKVRDSRSTFIQENVSHLNIHHGISIDVFPLDGCSADARSRRATRWVLGAANAAMWRKLGVVRPGKPTSKKAAIQYALVHLMSALLPLRLLRKLAEVVMARHPYDASAVIANWNGAWGDREVVPREWFGTGRSARFEGKTVTIPAEYDQYLRALYGDYMTPPPLAKQVSHHGMRLVDPDRPYERPRESGT